MARETERRRVTRSFSIRDLDRFGDLEWEQEVVQHRAQARHERPVNLSAKIEDYLKSYF